MRLRTRPPLLTYLLRLTFVRSRLWLKGHTVHNLCSWG